MTKEDLIEKKMAIIRKLNGEDKPIYKASAVWSMDHAIKGITDLFPKYPAPSRETLQAELDMLNQIDINSLPDRPETQDSMKTKSKIKWNLGKDKHGYSINDFLELVKALYEAKAIIGTQKDIIQELADILHIEIKNADQQIQSMKNSRNNDTAYKFLDTIKQALISWKEKDK